MDVCVHACMFEHKTNKNFLVTSPSPPLETPALTFPSIQSRSARIVPGQGNCRHTLVHNMASSQTPVAVSRRETSQISDRMRPCVQRNQPAGPSPGPVVLCSQSCPEYRTVNPLTHHAHSGSLYIRFTRKINTEV